MQKLSGGSDSWPNEMSEVQRLIQCSITAVNVKSSMYSPFPSSKIRCPFSESCSLGPHHATKGSAGIILSITKLSAWLRCTQTLETAKYGMLELPESLQKLLDIDTLCSTVFDGLESNYSDVRWLTSRAILSTKYSRLIDINTKVGSRFPGSYKTFLSADSVEDEDQNGLRYPAELLNSLNGGSSLPDNRIQLKKGFMVMLLRNICLRKDL